jgi:hypothetical protein
MPRRPRYSRVIDVYREQVDTYLSKSHGNRRSGRRAAQLLKPLMTTLLTGRVPREKLPDKHLKALLADLGNQMASDEYRLARAWYEHSVYGASQRSAASRWKVSAAELRALDRLRQELHYPSDRYRSIVGKARPDWAYDVDEGHEDVVIWLEDRAIEDIVLVALEAYAVPRQGVKFTETYGICFGSTKSVDETRLAHGRHVTRYVNISSVHIQLRAECYSSKVTYDLRSLETQMAVATHLFPQLDIVGDFHTHPYKDVNELRAAKGWNYSRADEVGIPTWVTPLKQMGYHPRMSLIVAVAKGGRRIVRPGRMRPNVVRFSIKRYHFYVACYRIIGKRYSDKHIMLNSMALPGM